MVTCSEAIKEVFTLKGQILTTKEIIDPVQKKISRFMEGGNDMNTHYGV